MEGEGGKPTCKACVSGTASVTDACVSIIFSYSTPSLSAESSGGRGRGGGGGRKRTFHCRIDVVCTLRCKSVVPHTQVKHPQSNMSLVEPAKLAMQINIDKSVSTSLDMCSFTKVKLSTFVRLPLPRLLSVVAAVTKLPPEVPRETVLV